jgi:cytochrome c553
MKNKYLLLALLLLPFILGCEEGDEFQPQHNQGKNCLECHSFTSGATVFKSLTAANNDHNDAAQGYSIQLLLESGKTLKFTPGNGHGNLLYNGDKGEINNFTSQVTDGQGKVINQSTTNSHDVGRLACNTCHTQNGLNNAPGRIVNFDYTANLHTDINTSINENKKSFNSDVMPILLTCTSCHGNSGNFTVTDANSTFNNITLNHFIDTTSPENSRLLLKATKSISHGGGERFNTSSAAYKTIITWINDGALNN